MTERKPEERAYGEGYQKALDPENRGMSDCAYPEGPLREAWSKGYGDATEDFINWQRSE